MRSKNIQANLAKLSLAFLLMAGASSASGLSLEQLRADPKLTPQRFAACFANFTFKYHAEVQDPATFLATESGDCDDYATLAAEVLAEKGYTTHLVTVRMAGENHVICYVEETRSYLDYNNRGVVFRTVASDGSLADIARKVAGSFDTRWSSAAEFTYAGGTKHLLTTILPDGSTAKVPVQIASAGRGPIRIDF